MRTTRRLMSTLIGTVMLVAPLSVTAVAATEKTPICHAGEDVLGNPIWELLMVSERSVDKHVDHGDGFPGEPVPGMAGYTFDETCVPTADEPTIFAVVYIDRDTGDGDYKPGFDDLIAQLVDGNGDGILNAGDLVETDVYPLDLDATATGSFTVNQHTVTSVVFTSNTNCNVESSNGLFSWAEFTDFEGYRERNNENPAFSQFDDGISGSAIDIVSADPFFPSPSGPTAFVDSKVPRLGDDPFVDVDLNCVESSG